jgi:hypothetical protein
MHAHSGEAPRFVLKAKEDQRLPFSPDDLGGNFYPAIHFIHGGCSSDTRLPKSAHSQKDTLA